MNISLLGSGNLATRLGIALSENGHTVSQVFSRSEQNASELAGILNCPFTSRLSEVEHDADIYIISVTDSAVDAILQQFDFGNQLVVHTAGSLSIDIFADHCRNFGVFYPLQTFSKNRKVDFGNIPICIEANSDDNLARIKKLADSLSSDVREISSLQRRQIHLAAVFACNFVNHFYTISDKLVGEKEMDFGILKPLIRETALKAMEFPPVTVQTGPAIRNNRQVMDNHLQMLVDHPEWQELYLLISNDIYKIQNKQ